MGINELNATGIRELLGTLQSRNLNTGILLVTTALILATTVFIQVFLQYRRLRHIPGPFLNSITPLVLTYHCFKGDISAYIASLGFKYGPLVRISPNMVLFWDVDTFRRICHGKSAYTKGLWFEFSRWDLKNYSLIAMRDNESRRERKSKIAPAFVGQGLATMEERVDRQVSAFLNLVERKYVSSSSEVRPMEFSHRSQFFTLDVVTCVTFGEPFGFINKDGDVEKYLETTEAMLPMFGVLGTLPWLVYAMHSWPIKYMMPGEGDKVGFGRLMKYAGDAVKQRLQPGDGSGEHDLIRAFLRSGVEPADVVQECITLIVAGAETTAVAIRMTLLALLTTPDAYRKLQAEIDTYMSGKEKRDAGGEEIISYTDAKSLPYLQGAIREGLRLWPPSAGLFSKEVPKEGDTVNGYYLPPGTEMGQSLYAVGRRQDFWGPDADVFCPDRWLEADPNKLQEMHTAVELAFSSGKYVCLGKQVALMELSKLFVELLWRYDIAAVNYSQPAKVYDPITFLTKDFWIRLTKRKK